MSTKRQVDCAASEGKKAATGRDDITAQFREKLDDRDALLSYCEDVFWSLCDWAQRYAVLNVHPNLLNAVPERDADDEIDEDDINSNWGVMLYAPTLVEAEYYRRALMIFSAEVHDIYNYPEKLVIYDKQERRLVGCTSFARKLQNVPLTMRSLHTLCDFSPHAALETNEMLFTEWVGSEPNYAGRLWDLTYQVRDVCEANDVDAAFVVPFMVSPEANAKQKLTDASLLIVRALLCDESDDPKAWTDKVFES